ncbi:type I secretion system permease/ATPase [Amorphus sp. 3PC139-8]|uniref:type I secretion system permease/ATPase n=1 Tax=Amorphus sp. 3PC139-8 TaxID=2735676 RepID=UPI00345D5950
MGIGSPRSAFAGLRRGFVAIALFSAVVNILMLAGPLYMLQVYDRVLTSHSVPTLVALSVLLAGLYVVMGTLDAIRSRALVKIGHSIDLTAAPSVFARVLREPLSKNPDPASRRALSDLDQIRQFFSGAGLAALFDLPWIPIYLAIVYLIHPVLGLVATGGALVLVAIATFTNHRARRLAAAASAAGAERAALAEAARRNADVIAGLGMEGALGARFAALNDRFLGASARASEVVGTAGVVTKVCRLALQSAVLGTGAYLAIDGAVTGGAMIAAAIIMARGLQPIETVVQHWRSLLSARAAYRNLKDELTGTSVPEPMQLPPPARALRVDRVTVLAPESRTPLVLDASLSVSAGSIVGVIGASGSGKSTVARTLVGAWTPVRGRVMLDCAPLDQWPRADLARHIGYLPQDVELFDASVAENIARMEASPDAEAVIAAARSAGIHERVLSLPEGYQTRIGECGSILSAGQRQRLALARALYRDPFLVVLDEPNANLDAEGEAALVAALEAVRRRGGIAVVIAHRPGAVRVADQIAIMEAGRIARFGAREEILGARAARPGGRRAAKAASLAVANDATDVKAAEERA